MRSLVLLLLILAAVPRAARSQSVTEVIFGRLTNEIAQSFARSYPLISASAGVSYRFDPATATFEREAAMVGQLFLERADPIGRGHWNFSASYQRVALDTIEGKDVHTLSDKVPIALIDSSFNVVGVATFDKLDASAVLHQTTFSVTYGITDDADVNLTLPVIYSNLDTQLNLSATVLSTGQTVHSSADAPSRDAGAGDVILRGRYRLIERDPVHVAAGLVLRFPSGNVEQLRGTGVYEVAPLLYASTSPWQPASWARITGYLNGGVDFIADDVSASEARWGIGLDWGISEGAAVGMAVLGRNLFQRLAPPGFFDVVRVRPGPRLTAEPLFGLQGHRPDYYDFSLGGRLNVWRDTVILFANAVFPLNDAGIRTEIIPLIGLEVTL